MIRRILVVVACLVLLANIGADPYSYRLNASDMHLPIPIWQRVATMIDALLLGLVAVLAIRQRWNRAALALLTEAVLHLSVCWLLVQRDGLNRFARGYTGEEYLSSYLLLLALRFVLLYGILHASHSAASSAPFADRHQQLQ